MKLYAPIGYWDLSQEEKDKVCNGCGAAGGIKVPDSFLGLSIKDACNIHDYMFSIGKTYGDFMFSNAMFLLNMVSIILSNSNWLMSPIRMSYASKYFIVVAMYGDKAFWEKKEINKAPNITYTGMFKKEEYGVN